MNWRTIARKPFNILGIETPGEDLDLFWRQTIEGKPYWWSNFPLVLNFDTCNYCGPHFMEIGPCDWCFVQHEVICGRIKHQEMPMDQIKWIMQNVDKYGAEMREASKNNMGLGFWDPFLSGDPMVNSRLTEILRLGKKIAPGIDVELFTCGALPEKAWTLCDRNVDMLHLTLSASNSEIYRRVHHGNKFEAVLKTMRYITDHRKPNQELHVHYIITEANFPYMRGWYELMGKEFPDWRRIFSPLIVSPDNVYAKQALGNLTIDDQQEAIRKIDPSAGMWYSDTTSLRQPCSFWANLSITTDGTIVKCCNWYNPARHNYGNIADYMKNGYDLHDAWMMRIANKHNNEVCLSCTLRRADAKRRLDKMKVKVAVAT